MVPFCALFPGFLNSSCFTWNSSGGQQWGSPLIVTLLALLCEGGLGVSLGFLHFKLVLSSRPRVHLSTCLQTLTSCGKERALRSRRLACGLRVPLLASSVRKPARLCSPVMRVVGSLGEATLPAFPAPACVSSRLSLLVVVLASSSSLWFGPKPTCFLSFCFLVSQLAAGLMTNFFWSRRHQVAHADEPALVPWVQGRRLKQLESSCPMLSGLGPASLQPKPSSFERDINRCFSFLMFI